MYLNNFDEIKGRCLCRTAAEYAAADAAVQAGFSAQDEVVKD